MKEIELTQRVHTGQYEHLDIKVRAYGEELTIDNVHDLFDVLIIALKRADGDTSPTQTNTARR